MINKEQVIKKIYSKKSFLEKTYFVEEIGVFGSLVRGQEKTGSDVDILVEFSEPIGIFDFVRLENYLSKLIGAKWI